ncbi:hypothetical protein ACF06V_20575 [Streptomyces bobili]|uniref:hypothetical protein n=1 Tax=Streptomyces bobili TaxID=67280 RepID=UPI0036F59578
MEKTWFGAVFRRRPHPVLRLLGNLALCAVHVGWLTATVTQFHSGWRWFAVPVGLLALLFDGRGVAVAVQDLRRRGAAPVPE